MSLKDAILLSLTDIPCAEKVARILEASLLAADPKSAVSKAMEINGELLRIVDMLLDLRKFERIIVIGAGKAVLPMAVQVSDILGNRISDGVLIPKQIDPVLYPMLPSNILVLPGSHPVPSSKSVLASRALISLLQKSSKDDLIIALISGGGSALMTMPEEDVRLEEIQELTSLLLESGANIQEINVLRKHLDQLKGGGLAHFAYPAQLVTLILSDVIGNPLDVIASGPTVADSSIFQDAWNVLKKYNLINKTPQNIVSRIEKGCRGEINETLKANNHVFIKVRNFVIGSNIQAALASVEQAKKEGFHANILTTYLHGEAFLAGQFLASILNEMVASQNPLASPACLVVGGETTVTIKGSGKGGRNQEVALGAVMELAGLKNAVLITLATDGEDGPTDAAGAIVSGRTLHDAMKWNLDPLDFLNRNDSYHFFEALGKLIRIGSTGTNVNDLNFLFTF